MSYLRKHYSQPDANLLSFMSSLLVHCGKYSDDFQCHLSITIFPYMNVSKATGDEIGVRAIAEDDTVQE